MLRQPQSGFTRFFFWWVFTGILLYPLAILAGTLIMFLLAMVYHLIVGNSFWETNSTLLSTIAVFAVMGGGLGFTIGVLQQMLLRQHFGARLDRWIRYSIVGGIGGGVLAAIFSHVSPSFEYYSPDIFLLSIPMFLTCIGIMQWFSLRHDVYFASMWILSNAVSGLVGMNLVFSDPADRLFWGGYHSALSAVLIIIGITAPAIITGIVVHHLYTRYAKQDNPNDVAYV